MLALWMTGSPAAAGWVAFAAVAPSVLVYMPAGALVDLWDARRVMLVSELGRGVAIASVVIALALGWLTIPLLISAAVIEEILEVFSSLAERRYVNSLVGHGQAARALAQMEARTHIVVLAGRPLGGFLFGVARPLPFIADTLSFIISVGVLIKAANMKHRENIAKHYHRQISWKKLLLDIREGIRWLYCDKFARTSIAVSTGTTFICQALIMIILGYAHSQDLTSLAIGVTLGGSGIGGAIGSVIASRLLAPKRNQWPIIRRCAWTIALIALLVIPERFSILTMALIMATLGFTGAVGNIDLGTYLMQNAPEAMLARATGAGRIMTFGALAAGPLVGGLVIQAYGIHGATLSLAAGIAALLLLSLPACARKTSRRRHRRSSPLHLMELTQQAISQFCYGG